MVKSVLSVLLLCLLVGLFTPLNQVDDNAVITLNGKSSGEFIYKKNITVSDFYDVNGLSLTLSNDNGVENLLKNLNAKPIHYFYDGEIENYYYFSEKLPKKEVIAGKKVNIHVAIKKGAITVGSPIIYYGY